MVKRTGIIAVTAAVAFSMTSCRQAPEIEAAVPSQALVDSVSYLIGVNFGYFIKSNNFAENPDELNFREIKKGMNDFINAEGDINARDFRDNFDVNPDMMNEIFDSYVMQKNRYDAAVNLAEGEEFLEDIYKKGGVVKTDSGLLYEILEDGNEVKAGPADTVWCHYTGALIDGTEFDKSNRDEAPVRFILSTMIPGCAEGLQLVGEGGRIKLYVPSELAYGKRAKADIKPNSALIFDFEVRRVGKVSCQ